MPKSVATFRIDLLNHLREVDVLPHVPHLWAHGELAPTSAFAVPGMEAGAGGLSTWLLELTLQVMLNIQDVYSANMSPSHWLSFPRITMQFFSCISGVFETAQPAWALST